MKQEPFRAHDHASQFLQTWAAMAVIGALSLYGSSKFTAEEAASLSVQLGFWAGIALSFIFLAIWPLCELVLCGLVARAFNWAFPNRLNHSQGFGGIRRRPREP